MFPRLAYLTNATIILHCPRNCVNDVILCPRLLHVANICAGHTDRAKHLATKFTSTCVTCTDSLFKTDKWPVVVQVRRSHNVASIHKRQMFVTNIPVVEIRLRQCRHQHVTQQLRASQHLHNVCSHDGRPRLCHLNFRPLQPSVAPVHS